MGFQPKSYEEAYLECPDLVYCGKCKYYKYSMDVYSDPYCSRFPKYRVTHTGCYKVYPDPVDINKNNDCQYFEKSRF